MYGWKCATSTFNICLHSKLKQITYFGQIYGNSPFGETVNFDIKLKFSNNTSNVFQPIFK